MIGTSITWAPGALAKISNNSLKPMGSSVGNIGPIVSLRKTTNPEVASLMANRNESRANAGAILLTIFR
jgi:hypothetical protein